MSQDNQEVKTTVLTAGIQKPEEELIALLQAKLEEASALKQKALKDRLAAAEQAVRDRRAAEAEWVSQQNLKYEAKKDKVLAAQKKQADKFAEQNRQARAQEAELERQVQEAEEAKHQNQLRVAEARKIEERIHLEELETQRLQQEIERASLPLEFEDKGDSLRQPEPEVPYFYDEHVHPVARPACTPDDYELLARAWQQTSGVKISQLQSQIRQLYDETVIIAALDVVMAHPEFQTRFKFKDAQYAAVVYVLTAGPNSLAQHIVDLDEAKAAKAQKAANDAAEDFRVRHGG